MAIRTLVLGAAGRDFHDFLVALSIDAFSEALHGRAGARIVP